MYSCTHNDLYCHNCSHQLGHSLHELMIFVYCHGNVELKGVVRKCHLQNIAKAIRLCREHVLILSLSFFLFCIPCLSFMASVLILNKIPPNFVAVWLTFAYVMSFLTYLKCAWLYITNLVTMLFRIQTTTKKTSCTLLKSDWGMQSHFKLMI